MAGISGEVEIEVGEFANSGEFCELVEELVKSSVQEKLSDEVEEQIGNIDIADTISDEIWNFRQWDEIVEKEVMRGYENWGLVVTHEQESAIDDRIENQLRDFISVSIESRCGVGKAFADAVTLMVKEVATSIVGEMIDQVIEIKKDTESVEVHENNTEFQQELEQTIGRITRQNIKMASRQSLFTLDRIWPPTGQTSGMALVGMEKVWEESKAIDSDGEGMAQVESDT